MTPGDFPPSFAGDPLLFAMTVFAQIMVALLAMEWAWRTVWAVKERPAPWRTAITAWRVILLMLLVGCLLRVTPTVVFNMSYSRLSDGERITFAQARSWFDQLAMIPFSIAWLVDRLAGGVIVYQLERKPLPTHLWPTWQQMRRPAKIGVGVGILAALLTLYR